MKIVQIKKKSGGTRTIYVQSPVEKHRYRAIGAALDRLLDQQPEAACLHGFRAGRSPVTNALAHVGFRFTLSMDLADFFDTVTPSLIRAAGCWSSDNPSWNAYPEAACKDGAARQGLSSSPAAANLAGTTLDRKIMHALAKDTNLDEPPPGIYTRYADDLHISSDSLNLLKVMRLVIPEYARQCGFAVNEKKTRIQCQDFGNRIICGVAVGKDGISAPRSTRRKLRAAQHQHPGTNKTRGLAEWCKLTPPKERPDKLGHYTTAKIVQRTAELFA